jgi:hypothetical protein
VRTNLLLGAAAVGLLITGAIAQTGQRAERIKDAVGHSQAVGARGDNPRKDENRKPDAAERASTPTSQNAASQNAAEPKKTVRTVYPNTQNAEQAVRESKSAQAEADASRRQSGDVTPQASAQPAPVPQQSAQAPSTPQSASPAPQNTPAATASAQSPGAQAPQPANALPATAAQPAPTATAAQSSAPSPAASQPNSAGSTSVIALDAQQQTSIGQAIAQRGVKPVSNVTFSIAVGTKVPAAVQLRALPSDVVTFVPQYRGYSYFVVEEQIMIVNPGTHEIVAIVPYTGAAPPTHIVETPKPRTPVAEKPMVSRSVNLHTEEKTVTRRPAAEPRKKTTTRSVSKQDYRTKERGPRSVTVEEVEPSARPAFRSNRFPDDEDDDVVVVPRQNGFFGLFR